MFNFWIKIHFENNKKSLQKYSKSIKKIINTEIFYSYNEKFILKHLLWYFTLIKYYFIVFFELEFLFYVNLTLNNSRDFS